MVFPREFAHFRILGASCAILGASWAILGASWAILGASWPILGHLGAILGPTWAILGHLGAFLGPSWGYLVPSWAVLGPSWGHLGFILGRLAAILGFLGPPCGHLGASWGLLGPSWGHLGTVLGPSWDLLLLSSFLHSLVRPRACTFIRMVPGWAGGMRVSVSAAPGLPGVACRTPVQPLPSSCPALGALAPSSWPAFACSWLLLYPSWGPPRGRRFPPARLKNDR